MKAIFQNPRIRRDLYHVIVPVTLATVMAAGSISGSAVFLIAWGVVRMVPNA